MFWTEVEGSGLGISIQEKISVENISHILGLNPYVFQKSIEAYVRCANLLKNCYTRNFSSKINLTSVLKNMKFWISIFYKVVRCPKPTIVVLYQNKELPPVGNLNSEVHQTPPSLSITNKLPKELLLTADQIKSPMIYILLLQIGKTYLATEEQDAC
ncbi:hypothetical protein L1887_26882 [Cichorium endivia]|nr:hypothetical protein L1887_26882 [Cichorium endivia]